MSSIKLESNASGTGIFTIASPNSNTNRTLTLPDSSGTLALAGSSLTGVTDSASPFETALGAGAGGSNTGTNNTFIGYNAGTASTTGAYNTALGTNALKSNTTAGDSTAIGAGVLETSTGQSNTGVGAYALNLNSTGTFNTAVGRLALYANTTGTNNTAVGYQALDSCTIGTDNVAVGSGALQTSTTISESTAIGTFSLYNATGAGNTSCGRAAGYNVTTGANNLLLGVDAGRSSSPSGEITTSSNNVVLGNNSISNLYCADTTISSSDARDKTDVQDFIYGLNWVTQLRPVTYRWDKRAWYIGDNATTEDVINAKPDGTKKRQQLHIGFLAQEELAVENQFGFGTSKDDMLIANLNEDESAYGLKYERLVPVLVNAIKELKAINDAQAIRIETLETKVAALEAK